MSTVRNVAVPQERLVLSTGRALVYGEEATGIDETLQPQAGYITAGKMLLVGTSSPGTVAPRRSPVLVDAADKLYDAFDGTEIPASGTSGAELGYAESTVASTAVTSSFADLAGLSIAIPAGSPAYMVEGFVTVQATATAANAITIVNPVIEDETGAVLADGGERINIGPNGGIEIRKVFFRRRMPATATAKTLKVRVGGVFVNMTAVLLAGAGVGNDASATPGCTPMYVQAVTR